MLRYCTGIPLPAADWPALAYHEHSRQSHGAPPSSHDGVVKFAGGPEFAVPLLGVEAAHGLPRPQRQPQAVQPHAILRRVVELAALAILQRSMLTHMTHVSHKGKMARWPHGSGLAWQSLHLPLLHLQLVPHDSKLARATGRTLQWPVFW
jgi:hypothetical protein